MSSFEQNLAFRLAGGPKTESESELEYIAKPENYTGNSLQTMQRLLISHNKQSKDPADPIPEEEPDGRLSSSSHRNDTTNQTTPNPTQTDDVNVLTNRKGSSKAHDKTRKISVDTLDRGSRVEHMVTPSSESSIPIRGSSYLARSRTNTNQLHSPSMSSLGRELRLKMAKARFKRAIKLVTVLLKWISSLTQKEEEGLRRGNARTFMEMASAAFMICEKKESTLAFDVSYFKAKKEVNISNEVKAILSLRPASRTREQLETALYGLQHLESFVEYPLHMQEKLCQVAWFQQVAPRRVIIRQGHFAENFYFILSGQALVRILERNPKTGEAQLRTAAVMKKGASFGELALLHHSRRTATVVSQDTVQLLTIGREDFFDIFMTGQGPDLIPDHVKFISTLDFLADWPIPKLLDSPESCLIHFFKRGVVIVKDSSNSDWLYIIKSGSCRVMKALEGVTPRLERSRTTYQKLCQTLPKIGGPDAEPRIDSSWIRRKSPWSVPDSPVQSDGQQSAISEQIPPSSSRKRLPQSARDRSHRTTSNCWKSPRTTPGISRNASPASHRKRRPVTCRPDERLTNDVHELQLKGPVFVELDVLKPRDVFGLSTIRFDDDVEVESTAVSLVSNGAECVMLSKRFFIQNANEVVKQKIRHHVRAYPTEDSLQGNLQAKVNWDLYKKRLLRETKSNKLR